MDRKEETRSSIERMPPLTRTSQGVGARHRNDHTSQRGGGYLDNCNDPEVSEKKFRDPRLKELEEMNLGEVWHELAENIGFDDFLLVWEKLSEKADMYDDGHRLYVPKFCTFSRYQRNRLIHTLGERGLKAPEIKTYISKKLGETISTNHIHKVLKKLRQTT